MRSRILATAASVLAAALPACAGRAEERSRGAAPALEVAGPGPLRFVDRIASATVRGALHGLDAGEDALARGQVIWSEQALRAPAPEWFDGAWFAALERDDARLRPARAAAAAEGVWRLEPEHLGLHRFVAIPAGRPFSVAARVRRCAAPIAGARPARLRVAELGFAAPATGRIAACARAVAADVARTGVETSLEPDAPAGEWRTLALHLDPAPRSRAISLTIDPGGEPLELDECSVRVAGDLSCFAASPRLEFDPGLHPLVRTLALHRGTAESLLVPGGATVEWQVRVPEQAPRVLFRPAALALRDGAEVSLAVTVDGAPQWRGTVRALPAAPGEWPALVEVDLTEHAGRRVALAFAASAHDAQEEAAGVFLAPRLLGAPARTRPTSVLLISLDTLRADHVGCYGDRRGLTPAIDALAAGGTRFAHVQSPSSWTLPTHMSALTGQHPIVHGAHELGWVIDPARTVPLAARLRAAGYATAAFTGGGPIDPRSGFGWGFDSYSTDDPLAHAAAHAAGDPVPAGAASAAAGGRDDERTGVFEWLERNADQPFFLFVHTFLVHDYRPAARYLERVAGSAGPPDERTPRERIAAARAGGEQALAWLKDLYAATVAQADERLVARLLEQLERLGIAETTLVVLMADHGEEFLEHGLFGHQHALHGESTRVPWIVRGPGVPAGQVHEGRVDLGDVCTTIAGRLRLPAEARDLGVDRLAAQAAPDEPVGSLLLLGRPDGPSSREALVVAGLKLMRERSEAGQHWRNVRLFDVRDDPGETVDVAGEDPARLEVLLLRIEARKEALRAAAAALPSSGGARTRRLAADEIERLRELGYIGG